MPYSSCIRLPFLHARLARKSATPGFAEPGLFLNPGHLPKTCWVDYYTPDALPYNQASALRLYEELANADLGELLRIQRLANLDKLYLQKAGMEELASLEFFVATERGQDADSATARLWKRQLEQAQKNLLWLWRHEELLLELADLVSHCQNSENHLLEELFEQGEKPDLPEAAPFFIASELSCNWQSCVSSAIHLLPADLPILAEGPMADDLLENFAFKPVEEKFRTYTPGNTRQLFCIRETPYAILDWKPQNAHTSLIAKDVLNLYQTERTWLVWRE